VIWISISQLHNLYTLYCSHKFHEIRETHTGYSFLDHGRNEIVLEELRVDPVGNKSAQFKQKWLQHVSRLEDIRYPEQLLDYRRIGRRPGRQLKRQTDKTVRSIQVTYWPNFVTRRRDVA